MTVFVDLLIYLHVYCSCLWVYYNKRDIAMVV